VYEKNQRGATGYRRGCQLLRSAWVGGGVSKIFKAAPRKYFAENLKVNGEPLRHEKVSIKAERTGHHRMTLRKLCREKAENDLDRKEP